VDSLLARAASGDGGAWTVLVGRYAKRVFGLLVRQCGDRDLAEEITQATFVQLVSHIGGYQERGRFEPWLFRIAMNRLRDEMRRRGRQARTMDMTGAHGDGPEAGDTVWHMVQERVTAAASGEGSDAEDPFERVSRAEQVQRLQAAIAAMSEADRTILELRHTAGLSFAEIAESLEQPLGTVLARGHRALLKLKKLMDADDDAGGVEKKPASPAGGKGKQPAG
jgi:RNA polymerase sigma-70 factor (ECF subfamily)